MQSLNDPGDKAPHIVENVSARKKIAFIDDYLCDLFESLLDQQGIDQDIDEDKLRALIRHPSGTEVILECAPFRLRAELKDLENDRI